MKGSEKVEKKFKWSDNPTVAKSIYGAVIVLLCVAAIVVGIIAAANKNNTDDDVLQNPPADDGTNGGEENQPPVDDGNQGDGTTPEQTGWISPVSGKVYKNHSTTVPAYSVTLEEWRLHSGIDISTAENAEVFAAADGTVSAVYSAPLLGKTVEITHEGGIKTVYSNLSSEGLIAEGTTVKAGEQIGYVGDSAISELADEAHLHFEVKVNDSAVNPLDYISDESKKVSLGITEGEAA